MPSAELKEWVDLLSKVALPVVLVWAAFLLTRTIEERKLAVSRKSEMKKRWAEDFAVASSGFMANTERYASILFNVIGMKDRNSPLGVAMQGELNTLTVGQGELGMRIRRLSALAPSRGKVTVEAYEAVHAYLGTIVKEPSATAEELMRLLSVFNAESLRAHAEILDVA